MHLYNVMLLKTNKETMHETVKQSSSRVNKNIRIYLSYIYILFWVYFFHYRVKEVVVKALV